MKLIPISNGKFAQVDDEDYDYLMQWNWHINKGYAYKNIQTTAGRKMVGMHRDLIASSESEIVDHKDRNPLNNQKSNLRTCTYSGNACNRKALGASKYLGVSINSRTRKGKLINMGWCAKIKKNGKQKHLGIFKNEIDAAKAYNEAAKIVHGEFANLNTF